MKRALAKVKPMMRALLGIPSVVADYTFGTVIVLVQLTIKRNMKLSLES